MLDLASMSDTGEAGAWVVDDSIGPGEGIAIGLAVGLAVVGRSACKKTGELSAGA